MDAFPGGVGVAAGCVLTAGTVTVGTEVTGVVTDGVVTAGTVEIGAACCRLCEEQPVNKIVIKIKIRGILCLNLFIIIFLLNKSLRGSHPKVIICQSQPPRKIDKGFKKPEPRTLC